MKVIIASANENSIKVLVVTEEAQHKNVSFSIGEEVITVKRDDVFRALQAVRKPDNSLSDKLADLDNN
jgi:hypothetical protein